MPHWQIPLCIWANPFLGLRLAESSDWSRLCMSRHLGHGQIISLTVSYNLVVHGGSTLVALFG